MCDGACCGVCRRAAPPTAPAHRDSLPAMAPSRRGRPHRQIYKHACVHSLMTHSIYLSIYLQAHHGHGHGGGPSLSPSSGDSSFPVSFFHPVCLSPFFSPLGPFSLPSWPAGPGRGETGTGRLLPFWASAGQDGEGGAEKGRRGRRRHALRVTWMARANMKDRKSVV